MNKKESIELLKKYDYHYSIGNPLITDTEYDLFRNEVYKKFNDDEYFKNIGYNTSKSEVKLPFILGSLNKIKSDKVPDFINKNNDIYASEKLDGASIIVTWNNGSIIFAATRGNGDVGQDITQKAKIFIPDIPVKEKITLRGEITLTNDSHILLGYKNRRNGVVGLINKDNIIPERLNKIVTKFYELIEGPKINNEIDKLKYIKNTLNLNIPEYIIYNNNITDFINQMNSHMINVKKENIYDIDGMVIAHNKTERQNVKYPTNKVAYKVNEEAIPVNVINIDWNVSKGGKIIPVIIIEPTEISGSTITKTTGFNAKYIKDNNIGINAIINLVKAGDVIPYITEVIKHSDNVYIPNKCPSCNETLINKGVDIVCNNDNCYESNIKRIAYFFKKLGADYITETTVINLGINSIEDMYELEDLDIADIEGFGIKKAEKIYYEIQKTLKTTPEKLMAAFSIDGIGETIARSIVDAIGDTDGWWNPSVDLSSIIGPLTAEKYYNNINKFKPLFDYLISIGLKFEERKMSKITGKLFALTGTGSIKRNELIKMITSKGGMVKTVSKSTDFLVAEDPNGDSGKLKTARKYGTSIISYNELLELLNG